MNTTSSKANPPAVLPKPQTIRFENNQHACLIQVASDAKPTEVLAGLGWSKPPKALISISGGAAHLEEALTGRLQQLFSRGIAAAAAEVGADLLDGGTQVGVMAMIGQGVADRGRRSRLLGIAPASLVSYPGGPTATPPAVALEENHSHFVLVDTPHWGGEIALRTSLLQQVAQQACPVLTVLVNGGDLSCTEVLHSVRSGWPVIVITGTGRLADQIAELHRNQPDFIADPRLAEIIADGRLFLFSMDGHLDRRIAELQRLIRRQLRGDTTLRQAWERFCIYDENASHQQHTFRKIQRAILILSVVGTTLALVQATLSNQLEKADTYLLQLYQEQQLAAYNAAALDTLYQQRQEIFTPLALGAQEKQNPAEHLIAPASLTTQNWIKNRFIYYLVPLNFLRNLLRNFIILIPIFITTLLAAANRFNAGSKWLLLRGAAEAIKREIFRYRAYSEIYSPLQTANNTREEKLAQKLKNISHQLMQTEVNLSAMRPYHGSLPPSWSTAAQDDGLSQLSPEQYLSYRLEDQYHYYVSKTVALEKKLKRLQWMIYIFGGLGTLLAAMGLELWIALTNSLVAALGTYLEYQQIETTLLKYNKAAADLANVRSWWIALSAAEQENQNNIDMLVGQTERTLHTEFSGWMQEMQETLTALQEEQQKKLHEGQESTASVSKLKVQETTTPPLNWQEDAGKDS